MSRRSSSLLALLLLASSAALARGKPSPRLGDTPDTLDDLQLVGWSKDEKRFAVRVYNRTDPAGDALSEPEPYCPGYVDHRGKKFRGGLMLQSHDGAQFTGTWHLQDTGQCTPPETMRDRLAQAKTALSEQGIELTAVGSTVLVPRKPGKTPSPRFKLGTSLSTTWLALPSGPWAKQFVEVTCRVETRYKVKPKDNPKGSMSSRATFTVRLRSGKRPLPLGEFSLGPAEWIAAMGGQWTPSVDRLYLSPSGKSLVLIARLDDGNPSSLSSSSVVLGRVELPERPESSSRLSASAAEP
ncbi:MAG: hypothetical protein ACJ8AT_23690 [Hyalangium sp.]|uniref:hypothetical protein n=1 Tax=Hyalangium sp. TaxID=2028555 RepID=UPI003899D48B